MKITLAHTSVELPFAPYGLGVGSLAAALKERCGVECRLVGAPISEALEVDVGAFADELLAGEPEVIGLSCYVWDLEALLAVASEVKARSPETLVVLGGPSAMHRAHAIMAANPQVDAVVLGEGEGPLAAMVEGRFEDLEAVPNLVIRGPEGEILRTEERIELADLSTLPSPYLTGVLEPAFDTIAIELSRGCRYRCRYCQYNEYNAPKGLRYRDLDVVRGELIWARERGARSVALYTAALNYDTERLRVFCELAAEVVPDGEIGFYYDLHHSFITEEQVELLRSIETHDYWISVESLNPEALRLAGRRPVDLERFSRALALLGGMKPVQINLILGLPGDTLEGFMRGVDWLVERWEQGGGATISSVAIQQMIVLPGSYYDLHREELGIETAKRGMPTLVGCDSFPEADIQRALEGLREHPASEVLYV